MNNRTNFIVFNTIKERLVSKPLNFLYFLLFDFRTSFLVSLLQLRIIKRLYKRSKNKRTKLYITLLVFTGVLNIPMVFYLFIIFPVLLGIPILILSKKYMGVIYLGGYLVSLNWLPKNVGRLILMFTIYKQFNSQALSFIETSSYVKQRYSREIITDFFVVIYAMQKIKKKIYNMKNPFRYAENLIESFKATYGLETIHKISDAKVRSICTSVTYVIGFGLITTGAYFEKREITKQLKNEAEAAERSQISAQEHELAILKEKHRQEREFFSIPEKEDYQKIIPKPDYKE